MIRPILKTFAARLACCRLMRSMTSNLIYPSIIGCLRDEILPDLPSPSGLAEAFAWKTHAYLVLNEELRPTGKDCSPDGMRCDQNTRARMINVIEDATKGVEGDILEFGVYKGESINIFAERFAHRHVYGFDSFEGLPEAWWTQPKGAFKVPVPLIDKDNVTLVKGLFSDSIPKFLADWKNRVAVTHVDCDLYESTRVCLLSVLPRWQVGTVLLFDEYYNYSEFARHEWLAWREIRATHGITAPCIAYDGKRAAFQIASLGQRTERVMQKAYGQMNER